MNKNLAIIQYRTAMLVFEKWHQQDAITEEELRQIDTIIAQKYGLSPGSIYRLTP